MTGEGSFNVWLNPLQWFEVDWEGRGLTPAEPTIDGLLQFITMPGTTTSLDDFIERYRRINVESPRWSTPPNDQDIVDKIIWPLRQGKANYVLGNYLATVVLCGLAAEMLAILCFDMNNSNEEHQSSIEEKQDLLKKFENSRQSERVKKLNKRGWIDDETEENFTNVFRPRNTYLHNWTASHKDLQREALAAYLATVAIALRITGLKFKAGKVIMDPVMTHYLELRGIYKPNDTQI